MVSQAENNGDTDARAEFLNNLRDLARAYPDNAVIRERFALALVGDPRGDTKADERVTSAALLAELRDLSRAYPADSKIREHLSLGMLRALIDAKKIGDEELYRILHAELDDLVKR